jgi:hypothetical protein
LSGRRDHLHMSCIDGICFVQSIYIYILHITRECNSLLAQLRLSISYTNLLPHQQCPLQPAAFVRIPSHYHPTNNNTDAPPSAPNALVRPPPLSLILPTLPLLTHTAPTASATCKRNSAQQSTNSPKSSQQPRNCCTPRKSSQSPSSQPHSCAPNSARRVPSSASTAPMA